MSGWLHGHREVRELNKGDESDCISKRKANVMALQKRNGATWSGKSEAKMIARIKSD